MGCAWQAASTISHCREAARNRFRRSAEGKTTVSSFRNVPHDARLRLQAHSANGLGGESLLPFRRYRYLAALRYFTHYAVSTSPPFCRCTILAFVQVNCIAFICCDAASHLIPRTRCSIAAPLS